MGKLEVRNPKHEARNKFKWMKNKCLECSKQEGLRFGVWRIRVFLVLGLFEFTFVSDLMLLISDFHS